jgi:cation diffusion facilitator CzcD-associated flavoprotein CzcO
MNTAKTVGNENLKANVLIIGGGGAGLAAAVAAAEKRVKGILIFEERQVPGGNAVFPDGLHLNQESSNYHDIV